MTNSIVSVPTNLHLSPFDSIRRYDKSGCEWWSARDLQKMLGYIKWQMFEKSIEQGLENLESAVGDTSTHALLLEVTLKYQKAKDYKLSRLACYHVTLACDSSGKPNVKAAKHYFATKTRESELAKQEPMSLMQMIAAQALAIDAQNKEIESIKQRQALEAARIDDLTQLTRQHNGEIDRIFNPNGHYFSVIGYARNRGISVGIETAKEVGRKCSAYCKGNNIKIERLNDPRFGSVGSYPESVIQLYI